MLKDPGPLVVSIWVKGNPVWGGQLTPEAAREMAAWWETRSDGEGRPDDAAELRNVARRLRRWATNYEVANDYELPAFATEGQTVADLPAHDEPGCVCATDCPEAVCCQGAASTRCKAEVERHG